MKKSNLDSLFYSAGGLVLLAIILIAANFLFSAFKARGGKLIQYHGWNDPAIPARSTGGSSGAICSRGSIRTAWPRASTRRAVARAPGLARVIQTGPAKRLVRQDEGITALGPDLGPELQAERPGGDHIIYAVEGDGRLATETLTTIGRQGLDDHRQLLAVEYGMSTDRGPAGAFQRI